LLSLQVVNVTLAFRIGHAVIATLRIFRQLILKAAALAIRHGSIAPLRVRAQAFEFEIDRRVGVEAAGVTGIETTIAIVATGTGVTGPIGPLETGPIIAPIPLLSRAITPARLILVTSPGLITELRPRTMSPTPCAAPGCVESTPATPSTAAPYNSRW